MDIIMTGWAGDTGSAVLAEHYREELMERLTPSFLNRLKEIKAQEMPAEGECMIPIGSGGVFAALWQLAKESGMGIAVDMEQIPIRQETIEVCELLEVNPYQLQSGGYLYLRPSGANILDKEEFSGVVIGVVHSGKDKAIRCKEGIRYINRPEPDELERLGIL